MEGRGGVVPGGLSDRIPGGGGDSQAILTSVRGGRITSRLLLMGPQRPTTLTRTLLTLIYSNFMINEIAIAY